MSRIQGRKFPTGGQHFCPAVELQMCCNPGITHVFIPQTSTDIPVRTVKDPKATEMCVPGQDLLPTKNSTSSVEIDVSSQYV